MFKDTKQYQKEYYSKNKDKFKDYQKKYKEKNLDKLRQYQKNYLEKNRDKLREKQIHGGPITQYDWYFMHEFYYLASKGFVVYFSNPRGGRGYGEEHAKAIWGGWGDADYADLMTWADYMEKQPYIDSQRMGVTGGSYGGYMTAWMIGHTQRFKAAATQRCVSNFISMWGSSDMNWVFQEVLNDKPPFEDMQKFWDHSPIKYIGNARTPTLVLHNESDLRCPIEQGEQVFVALKSLGVESEMVRFPSRTAS